MGFESEGEAYDFLVNGDKAEGKAEGGLLTGDEPEPKSPIAPAAKAIPQSSNSSEPTIVNDLGHYSEAIEQLKKLPQQKGTVGQFKKAIASKVSPEEFKWSNFDEKFPEENTKVDKSQLIGHFHQNLPKLKETVRSGTSDPFNPENNPENPAKYADYQSPGGQNYREILLHIDHPAAQYVSRHWDEPNVLAHIRMNDRAGPNGEKLLHIEEVQSDWGQHARSNGTKDISEKPSAVTPAPFIHNTTKWTELAMKRLLKEAAEGGYDGVTLSSGDEQKQRWRGAAGADGLKSFYDDVLPKTLEKLAKVHDKDARVTKTIGQGQKTPIDLLSRDKIVEIARYYAIEPTEAMSWWRNLPTESKQHLLPDVDSSHKEPSRPFLPITPALKASVKRGQRMFKDGGKVKINLPSDERKKIIDKALNLTTGNRSTAASNLTAAKGA